MNFITMDPPDKFLLTVELQFCSYVCVKCNIYKNDFKKNRNLIDTVTDTASSQVKVKW